LPSKNIFRKILKKIKTFHPAWMIAIKRISPNLATNFGKEELHKAFFLIRRRRRTTTTTLFKPNILLYY
jgi:hypothetical protein